VITPFFLGMSAAAVASGDLLPPDGTPRADYIVGWTSPFALVIGAMAVALCATLAAIYLTVEARDAEHDEQLAEGYRLRAMIAGGITAVLGVLGLWLSSSQAQILWQGMLDHGVPVVIITMIIGLFTAIALFLRHYKLARILVVAETAFMLGAWGLAQFPYIILPHATIDNSSNDPTVIVTLLVCVAVGMVIVIPSLYYLFSVFKLAYPVPGLRRDEAAKGQQQQAQIAES
jgi:cytochrome d ubiquinol oxidase subunit II